MASYIERRQFLATLLGGAASWPLAARAQPERMRSIGVLMTTAADDPESLARVGAFLQQLQQLGWTDGRNVQMEYRWGSGSAERIRKYATELVALTPEVILASSSPSVAALRKVTRTVPIVFANVVDPVGSGFVNSLARPGGNVTGLTPFEYSLSSKWLELLKETVPRMTRVAVIRHPATNLSGIGQFAAIQVVAPSLGVELFPVDVRDAGEIERALGAFVRSPSDGLIVTSAGSVVHRELIIALAAQHRLPTVYANRTFATGGGLISYGPDQVDHFRRAAGYVDRILKGEKPADLPVQAPTKYELVINLKTAKALGLDMPASVLARADEVIE
jgi:putative tryptophan/tyrosine transport system substrate-binding protein